MGTKTTTQHLYLKVMETRDGEYFHLRARVVTQKYEGSGWFPYGVDDDYSDGPLYSGVLITSQGDAHSRQRAGEGEGGPVYGFGVEYRDVFSVDLRKATRMAKTLKTLEAKLHKLSETRGYPRSFGEYLGRVAEALGAKGMAFQRNQRSQMVTGQTWEWVSVGDGVNRANHRVHLWVQEAKPASEEAAS